MLFDPSNFLTHVRNVVTGGGRDSSGYPKVDSGFFVDTPMPLSALELNTTSVVDTSDAGASADPVIESGAYMAADETNARVIHVDEAVDTIFHLTVPVPRDYDEATDTMVVRVMASMVSVSTDTDVELDSEMYVKVAGAALSADKDPTAPGTVLSATEQWVEFDLSGNALVRDAVVTFKLITNGANDTNGEEVLIHAVEVAHRSCLVSYDDEDDAEGNCLR